MIIDTCVLVYLAINHFVYESINYVIRQKEITLSPGVLNFGCVTCVDYHSLSETLLKLN